MKKASLFIKFLQFKDRYMMKKASLFVKLLQLKDKSLGADYFTLLFSECFQVVLSQNQHYSCYYSPS